MRLVYCEYGLNQLIVGMAATPDGKGYWLVAADGEHLQLPRLRTMSELLVQWASS